jgi:Zn finger protein HypA/HybF involved in hydrogenase expression
MGKLRADGLPELAILYALFQAVAPAIVCPKCGQAGLKVGPSSEESGWPEPVKCAACGKAISKERLEAVRGTTLCAACQRESDLGRPRAEQDFCPRCGAAMEVRVMQAGGSTRYVLGCGNNPPCALG